MDGKVTGLIQLQFEIEAFFVAILNFFPPSLHFGCATMSFDGPPRPSLAAGSHKGESGEVPNPIFQSSIDFGA
jgi:hypothetical protein